MAILAGVVLLYIIISYINHLVNHSNSKIPQPHYNLWQRNFIFYVLSLIFNYPILVKISFTYSKLLLTFVQRSKFVYPNIKFGGLLMVQFTVTTISGIFPFYTPIFILHNYGIILKYKLRIP